MEVMFVVIFVVGILIGCFAGRAFPVGTLRIDHTDPDKDVYRFDIDNLDALSKKKSIVLKVDNDAVLSQE